MKYNNNKNLGIIGLGHVGLPTALGFAELGFQVFGTDQKYVLDSINSNKVPFYEPDLNQLLIKHIHNNFKLVQNIKIILIPYELYLNIIILKKKWSSGAMWSSYFAPFQN